MPEDRGCTELRIDAEKLLPGCELRAITVQARDFDGMAVPAQAQVGEGGVVSFTTSADVVDWLVSP